MKEVSTVALCVRGSFAAILPVFCHVIQYACVVGVGADVEVGRVLLASVGRAQSIPVQVIVQHDHLCSTEAVSLLG